MDPTEPLLGAAQRNGDGAGRGGQQLQAEREPAAALRSTHWAQARWARLFMAFGTTVNAVRLLPTKPCRAHVGDTELAPCYPRS